MNNMYTVHRFSSSLPPAGKSHKEFVLGPALVPRYISIARNETLVFDLKPRHLSGYQPTNLLPPKLRRRMIDSRLRGDILTGKSLTAWSDSARKNLTWLDQSLSPAIHNEQEKHSTVIVPSRSLTLFLLNTSIEEIEKNIRALCDEEGGQGFQEVRSAAEMVEEFQNEISEELMGTIANFGFLSRQRGKSQEHLWKEDAINNDFAAELIRALPLDFNRIEGVFSSLQCELLGKLTGERISGDWGELNRHGKSIYITAN